MSNTQQQKTTFTLESIKLPTSRVALRPYQRKAVDALLTDLKTHTKLGLIAPTGAGKTIIMQTVIENVLPMIGHGFNVLVVSHLSVLQTQTLGNFERRLSMFRPSRYQGRQRPDQLSRVVITTMQTLSKDNTDEFLTRRLLNNKTALIFIDEAQMYGARSYELIESKFPDAAIIGMSASPYRKNKYSFNQFEKVSYSISLNELIEDGYLVEPRLHTIDLAGMDIPQRIAHVAGIYNEKVSPNGALVYWNTKSDAEKANAAFFKAGFKTAYITDDTTKKRKEQILNDFESGKITIIHNVNILSAGYDTPNVHGVFMPMGCGSPVYYIQRVGRGLRLKAGKSHCDVFIYGDAPTIKRGLYHKLQRTALRTKDDPFYGERGDALEQLDWLECEDNPNSQKIKYTREVVEAYQHFTRLGHENLAKMVRFKKFPKRYLRSLITAQARADEQEKGQPTDGQIRWLTQKKFDETQIRMLTKAEATSLIGCIQSGLNRKWVIQHGLHSNKHISEIPQAYLGALIKKKQFRHPVLKMYQAWKHAGRPDTGREI